MPSPPSALGQSVSKTSSRLRRPSTEGASANDAQRREGKLPKCCPNVFSGMESEVIDSQKHPFIRGNTESGRRESNPRSQLEARFRAQNPWWEHFIDGNEVAATLVRHETPRRVRRVRRVCACPTDKDMANNHDADRCGGCDRVLDLDTLTELLGVSTHTLYKWAAAGYPAFPRRLRLRNRSIAVTCKSTKVWMLEVTQ